MKRDPARARDGHQQSASPPPIAAPSLTHADAIASQTNRPAAMAYFDAAITEIRGKRIEELLDAKQRGQHVLGIFCVYVPEEIILAAGGACVGLCAGADVGTSLAEQLLPSNTCALVKSFVGFKLADLCPYFDVCDLVIGETTCDGKKKAYELFGDLQEMFVMEVPQTKSAEAKALWRAEVDRLTQKIEELSSQRITAQGLRQAMELVNAKRSALHRLSNLRRARPSPISGRDALLVNQVQFYDEPRRFTERLNALCDEVEGRVADGVGIAPAGAPRVLVAGCPMVAPNWKVPLLVETNGAVIVGEESCVGERSTRYLVAEEGHTREELLDCLAERYLRIDCACFTPNTERVEHVLEMARCYEVDGVIHYAIQFCGPYTIEAHKVRQALDREGIPFLRLETDYSVADVGQLDTRVQAFLEVLRPTRAPQ